MSARCAGWSAFRHCIAAFKDLILHCWLRQRRRQRTASASQVFFFSSSFSLFFPSSQREGRKCSGKKKSVPICSFLPLTKLLPLFLGEGSPPKSRKPQPDQHLRREPLSAGVRGSAKQGVCFAYEYLFVFENLSTWLGVRCPQISQS